MPDGSPWPKISIVTPSYGQGQFIEETIRAVLLQGYPDIEFIIIDGGSQDNTVEVIKKYEPFIAYWVSEKDRGQSDAINKGFTKATGEIYYWLNSDDFLQKNIFPLVSQEFKTNSEIEVLYGNCYYIDEQSKLTDHGKGGQLYFTEQYSKEALLISNIIAQPTAFWRATVWSRFGSVKE
jgi:glycosyltransferase involved in cell wall biosynthesis